ncbi:MAG: hypothetical protein AVDCRST_MAG56-4679 [uncultured Cytophagales bacterium]|uniref:Uncharacterized protein n=1 Tax=uncultured Cytophagales bacterium TaxID=158755 RepID=A0A6J4JZ14_9SPHI|nr:MAG: hypothetical protein AVDCRST_MAG56-4679 [uncultured Cytophagales bacterium]
MISTLLRQRLPGRIVPFIFFAPPRPVGSGGHCCRPVGLHCPQRAF